MLYVLAADIVNHAHFSFTFLCIVFVSNGSILNPKGPSESFYISVHFLDFEKQVNVKGFCALEWKLENCRKVNLATPPRSFLYICVLFRDKIRIFHVCVWSDLFFYICV